MPDSDVSLDALNERAYELSQAIGTGIVGIIAWCDDVLALEAQIAARRSARGEDQEAPLRAIAVRKIREHLAVVAPAFGDCDAEALEAAAKALVAEAIAGLVPTLTLKNYPPAEAGEGGE
jgi:hypothetical protein